MKTKAYMIFDMQFGSTGKGLLAGYLAKTEEPDTVVTAWGPNAGHTYIDSNGREYIHRMLANGIVSPKLRTVLIGPGSVIDLDALYEELKSCSDIMAGKRLVIHPQAAIVTSKHAEEEARNVKIGSTMKGTGAAIIQRILRDPDNSNIARDVIDLEFLSKVFNLGIDITVSKSDYDNLLVASHKIQIEGAQGYSLSIYHGLYPYTTSRDVTPAQVLADCAIPYTIKPSVYGTLRTYPIRVADRYNEDGYMIGTSGPGYGDQEEIEWESVGVEPELTTVTKLPRRIFTFSLQQYAEALYQCGPDKIFLNFANYLNDEDLAELIRDIEGFNADTSRSHHCKIEWIGFGPKHDDIACRGDYDNE